jgi:PAS domain S-box-containing protein
MNKNQEELRKRALSLLKRNPERLTQIHIDDINKIIEELNIYQVELELQNDELRNTQLELEKTKNEYIDLFESAPYGYLILNHDLEIINCNQTFAKIVKYPKNKIIGERISHFVHPDFQDTAYLCFNEVFAKSKKSNCEIKVLRNSSYPQFYRIDGYIENKEEGAEKARFTFININKEIEHKLELELNSKMFEKIEDAIIKVDATGTIEYFNKKAQQFTGWSPKEAHYAPIEDVLKIFHPKNDLYEFEPLDFFDSLRNKKEEVAKCLHKKGTEFYLEFSVTAIEKTNTDKAGYLVFFRDKTEDYVNQLMLGLRLELITYSSNHSLDELLIKAVDEVEKLTQSRIGFYHFISEDQNQIHLQQWSTSTSNNFCNAEGIDRHYELSKAGVWADAMRKKQAIVHNDYANLQNKKGLPEGHAEIIREMVVPVMRDGQVVAILGVGNKKSDYTKYDIQRLEYIADVTWEIVQQKRIAENLKESQQFLENVFDAIQDGITVVDKNLNIIARNNWIKNTFWSSKSIIGSPCFKAFKGNNKVCENCPVHQTLKTKKPHTGIVEFEENNSDSIYFEVTTFPVLDDNNEISSIIEYIKDVTDRQLAQNELLLTNEELKLAKQKAEESDRLKSAFLANMSHEIRTPMNGILGFAELLKEPDLSSSEHQHFLEIIERSGERMLNIINDLIDISKIESKLMDVHYSNVNLNQQLEYLYAFFKLEAEKKELKLDYNCGATNAEAIIKTDKEKFLAIFINLIKNAVKYTKSGSINFGYDIIDNKIQCYVEDTGLGIPKEAQKKVFDRFVQADLALTSEYEGAGLGLAITKGYVELLGGEVWLESKYRKGSKFYFTIPYQKIKAKKRKYEASQKSIENIKDLNILIVDDDEVAEEYLKNLLINKVNTLCFASNGNEAVEISKIKRKLDVILMDVKMPLKDGYEATKNIREFNKEVKIIAQTAFNVHGEEEKAMNAGCDYYLPKPIRKRKLMEILADIAKEI